MIQSSQPSPASPRSLRSLLLFFVVVGTAIASGCGDGLLDLAVPEGEALVRIISGEGQEGEVGSYLPEPVVVEVLSAGGAPQSGVPVEWSFVDGFGSTSNQGGEAEALETVVSYTDGRGRASASWLLGSEAGAQLGTVGLLDLEPPVAHSGGEAPSKMRVRLTAFAHAAPPAALEVTPEEGVLHPGESVSLSVEVRDRYGNAVPNPAVQWTSSEQRVVVVDAAGRVSARSTGNATITATVDSAQATVSIHVIAAGGSAVERASGNGQTAQVAEPVPNRPTVRMVDGSGQGVAGVRVTWTIREGGGAVSSGTTTTGIDGRTSVSWVMGEQAGTQRLEATSEGWPSVTFEATAQAGPLAGLRVSPSESVLGHGDVVPLRATGVDRFGNDVGPIDIAWSSGDTQVATVSTSGLVMGVGSGKTVIVAQSGSARAEHRTTGVGGGGNLLRRVGGSGQTAAAGRTLPDLLRVRAVSGSGAGLPGRTVQWSIRSGGGSLSSPTSTTDSEGYASVVWTLGGTPGVQAVDAQAEGMPAVSFEATATVGSVATLALTPSTSTLGIGDVARLSVVARDGAGNVVDNPSLTWTTSDASVATVSEGLVRGVGPGEATIVAVAGEASAGHAATVVGTGPRTLQRTQGDGQSARVGESLPTPPAVRVVDASGNGVQGVQIRWRVISGAGSLSATSTTTGSDGRASVEWTLGSSIGEQTLEAATEGLTPVSFRARATPGPLDRIEVSPGSSVLDEGQSLQLGATGRDRFGNRVEAAVAWSSTAPGVASVSTGGLLTGVSGGSAIIQASASGITGRHETSVRSAPTPPSGEWNEPADFVTIVDEPWNSFGDRPWYHDSGMEGNVAIQNGKVVWTFPAGMQGGHTPGSPVVLEYGHGPYEYHRDEGVTLSSNFHGHQSGVNKFRFWSDVRPKSPIGFFGAGASRLTLGINTGDWPMGVRKLHWDAPENYASPTLDQAEVVRGRPHDIESLIYLGTPGGSDGWLKVWLNGVLVLDFRNLAIVWPGEVPRLSQIHFAPVWGGIGDEVPVTQTLSIDRSYVSVRR